MMKNVVILLSTAAGAALGFRMLDSYRADARLEKQRIVERIIEEEVAKQRRKQMQAPRKALPTPGASSSAPPSTAAPVSPRPPQSPAPRPQPPTAPAPKAVPVSPRPPSASPKTVVSPAPPKAAPVSPRPSPSAAAPKAPAPVSPRPVPSTTPPKRALPTPGKSSGLASMRNRAPPPPPRAPAPSPAAPPGTLRSRAAPAAGARKRAPTLVPASVRLAVEEGKRCRECGFAGVEDFCANCGAPASSSLSVAVAAVSSVEAALKEAEAHLKTSKKICMDCYNESVSDDAFCAECGGKLLACDSDDENDEATGLLEEEEKPARAAVASVAGPSKVLEAPKAAPVVSSVVIAAAASQLSLVFLEPPDPGNKEKVFVIDLGSEYSRFGFSTDAECLKIRSCVDGRANVQHNLLQIKGQIFPFDGSENAFANNEYLSDLIRKMMRTFNYTAQTPLLISTNVQPNSDGVSEWIFSCFDGLVLDKIPPMLFVGFSPVMSLMCALNSCYPTGIVVEISASGCLVVPVYSGMKIDHCIVQSPFGGRMFQEFLISKSAILSKFDEPSLARVIREQCFASLDFRADFASRGFETTAANASQAWKGWKVKNANLDVKSPETGLGVEVFAAVELFFTPSLVPKFSFASLQEMIRVAVLSVPCIDPCELLRNVVVSGDAGNIRSFVPRLKKELVAMFPSVAVNVVSAPANSAWQGAKLFASRSFFPRACTTEEEAQTISHFSQRFF